MKGNEDFSDEVLSAFIDGELSHDERTQILSALRKDVYLTQRVCDLQKIRGLVQLAYSDEVLPAQLAPRVNKTHLLSRYSFVASVLILFGILIGWTANKTFSTDYRPMKLADSARKLPGNNTWHIMFHVSNNDPQRLDVLLSETEYLLHSYKKNKQKIEIELLANSTGINLLKVGSSIQSKKLNQLTTQYPNLILSACGQTLARLQKETGKKITLLPGTKIVRSAIYQATKRQKEGWSYVRI
jgi:hypothetical protein